LQYTRELTNLLAQLMAWEVMQSLDDIKGMLGGGG
jgi:hypothetical protein